MFQFYHFSSKKFQDQSIILSYSLKTAPEKRKYGVPSKIVILIDILFRLMKKREFRKFAIFYRSFRLDTDKCRTVPLYYESDVTLASSYFSEF